MMTDKDALKAGWKYEFDEASMKMYREIITHNKDTSSWEDRFVSNALDEIERLKSGTTHTSQDKDTRIKELEAKLKIAAEALERCQKTRNTVVSQSTGMEQYFKTEASHIADEALAAINAHGGGEEKE